MFVFYAYLKRHWPHGNIDQKWFKCNYVNSHTLIFIIITYTIYRLSIKRSILEAGKWVNIFRERQKIRIRLIFF